MCKTFLFVTIDYMKKLLFVFALGLISLSLSLLFKSTVLAESLQLDSYNGTLPDIEVVEKSMYFHKGWNLVHGLAGKEWITGGTGINQDNIKAIFGMNLVNKKYVRFYPSAEKEQVTDIRYIPEMTYWVYSNNDGTLFYKSSKIDILKFTWQAGWNIIAVAPEFMGKSLNEIKGSCNFEKAYWWSPREQIYVDVKSNLKEITKDNTNIGTGLILKMTNECKLNVSGLNTIVPPPQLPN